MHSDTDNIIIIKYNNNKNKTINNNNNETSTNNIIIHFWLNEVAIKSISIKNVYVFQKLKKGNQK